MHSPSLAVAFTLITGAFSRHSDFKRQNASPASVAASAAYLNAVLGFEICTIASGVQSAAAALGIKTMGTSICVAPTNHNTVPAMTVSSTIMLTGCPNAPSLARRAAGGTVGGNTCSPQYLSIVGAPSANDGTVKDTFTIPSSNSTCSGVTNPFMLGATAAEIAMYSTPSTFLGNSWLIDCDTGNLFLADPTLHLCIGVGPQGDTRLYSTTDKTCSTTYSLSFNTFATYYTL